MGAGEVGGGGQGCRASGKIGNRLLEINADYQSVRPTHFPCRWMSLPLEASGPLVNVTATANRLARSFRRASLSVIPKFSRLLMTVKFLFPRTCTCPATAKSCVQGKHLFLSQSGQRYQNAPGPCIGREKRRDEMRARAFRGLVLNTHTFLSTTSTDFVPFLGNFPSHVLNPRVSAERSPHAPEARIEIQPGKCMGKSRNEDRVRGRRASSRKRRRCAGAVNVGQRTAVALRRRLTCRCVDRDVHQGVGVKGDQDGVETIHFDQLHYPVFTSSSVMIPWPDTYTTNVVNPEA